MKGSFTDEICENITHHHFGIKRESTPVSTLIDLCAVFGHPHAGIVDWNHVLIWYLCVEILFCVNLLK